MKKLVGLAVVLTFVCLAPSVQAQDWRGSRGRSQTNYHHKQHRPAQWGHQNYHRGHYRPTRWGNRNYQQRRYHQAQRWRRHNNQSRWHKQSRRWGYHNDQRRPNRSQQWTHNNYRHQRNYGNRYYQPVRGGYAQQANPWQNSSQVWTNSE